MFPITDQQLSITIVPAEPQHLPGVLDIARCWQLGQVADEIRDQGFLLAGWDLANYAHFLDEAEHFYVATHGRDIAGFIIAYDQRHDHLDPMLNRELKRTLPAYVNIEQICVDRRWVRRGVATRLWAHLFAQCQPVPIVVEIVSSPPNVPSATLHRKLGFSPFIDLVRPGGTLTTVWRRDRRGHAA